MFIRFVEALERWAWRRSGGNDQSLLLADFRASCDTGCFYMSGRFGVIGKSRALMSWFSNRCVVLWDHPLAVESDALSFLMDDTVLRHPDKPLAA